MADPRTPIVKFVAATDAGATADFSAEGKMGAAYVVNRGTTNPVYVAFNATPANTNGNGRFLLRAGASINLDDIVYTTIGFRCTAGLTTQVDVIGLPRPGNSGIGFS